MSPSNNPLIAADSASVARAHSFSPLGAYRQARDPSRSTSLTANEALFILLLVGFLVPSRDSSACQCGTKPSAPEAYAASPLVALVRVSQIDDQWTIWRRVKDWFRSRSQMENEYERDGGLFMVYRDYGFSITAQVVQQWKGAPTKTIQFFTGRGGGDCGYSFELNATYLIYPGAGADGGCYVWICGRITPGPDAGPDVQALDAISQVRRAE